MRLLLRPSIAAAMLALAIAATPTAASAAPTYSCTRITGQNMYFESLTPTHEKPYGSSPVTGYLSAGVAFWVDGVCSNSYGNVWWRVDLSLEYGYVYDGYRVP